MGRRTSFGLKQKCPMNLAAARCWQTVTRLEEVKDTSQRSNQAGAHRSNAKTSSISPPHGVAGPAELQRDDCICSGLMRVASLDTVGPR
jgi:hypothetical protein